MMEFSWKSQPSQLESMSGRQSRKRTVRACDSCFQSRTRCDGKSPCERCVDKDRPCRYTRRSKRRGRIPRASKEDGRSSLTSQSSMAVASLLGHSALPETRFNWLSASRDNIWAGADDGAAHPFSESGTTSPMGLGSPLSSTVFNQPNHVSLPLPQSRVVEDRPVQDVEQATHTLQQRSIRPDDLIRTSRGNVCAGSTTESNHVSSRSVVDSPRGDSSSACRYNCLEPLLPHISNIISPSVACDLLDVYFIEPQNNIFSSAASYVLVPILRKKSLLRPSHPRPTTRALLCTMLWCATQTADIATFYMPGSRSRISNHLYEVATALIAERDPDRLRRIPDGLRAETTRLECYGTKKSEPTPLATPNESGGTIDDVLTFTLLAIAISGGDFKSDSLKWWSKAVRLALALGLNRDDELDRSSGLPFMEIHESSQGHDTLREVEEQEERRRVFWLLYCLDRHLALSFNLVLKIPDEVCAVYTPLPDSAWEDLDTAIRDDLPLRVHGPLTVVQGTGFFEYFLPLMAILGDIVDLHHRRNHPRFGGLSESQEVAVVLEHLDKCGVSLVKMARSRGIPHSSELDAYATNVGVSPPPADLHGLRHPEVVTKTQLVLAYSTHILHVLYVLLHGKWDVICMLDSEDDWITSSKFVEGASHAISASHALSEVLQLDPDLTFMPYLFGIYLLHGSFILLLFADRMPQLGANNSVEEACEIIIRAHEKCVVTLSTEFQRNFRKVLRSTMNSVSGFTAARDEESRARRKALSLYRWTKGGRGLCL